MNHLLKILRHWISYWLTPIFPLRALFLAPAHYRRYINSWSDYARLADAEPLHFLNSYPRISDNTSTTGFDAHYLYQAVWAMERIAQNLSTYHIDIGSDVKFATMLTTHLPVYFVDIRPLPVLLPNFMSIAGSILELPFKTQSQHSLSCLHVMEHIGLGRYGDPLDPLGTQKTCAELARVIAPNGNLLISTPIGKSRVCFNAHRIHTPKQILSFFPNLKLMEFSAVSDDGKLVINADIEDMASAEYACGLFWFQRES